MKTKIGKLPVKLSPALGMRLTGYLRHHPKLMGIHLRPLYSWKCAEVAPQNPAMPTSITVEPRLVTQWLTPTFKPHEARSKRQWTYMLNATGATKPAALNTAMLAAVPARRIPINLNATMLAIPFNNQHSLDVVYQVRYDWFYLQPDPNKAKVICLVGLPVAIDIGFIVKSYCGPPTIWKRGTLYLADYSDAPKGGKAIQTLEKEIILRDRQWRRQAPFTFDRLLYLKEAAQTAARK